MKVENLRALGVVACLVGTVLFFVGALSDHWVEDSNNGHWGLWEYCDNSLQNKTMNSTTNLSTTTVPTTTPKDDDDETDEEECIPFDFGDVPAFLHVVRVIMVVAGLLLGWGLLTGRNLRMRIIREDTCIRTHLSELVGIIACIGAYLGLVLFANNYRSVKEEVYADCKLGWSYHLLRTGVIIVAIAATIMMYPTFHESRCQNSSGICIECNICVCLGPKRRAQDPSNRDVRLHRRQGQLRSSSLTDIHTGTRNRNQADNELSLQMSETDSDIFIVVMRNDEDAEMPNRNTQPTNSTLPGSDLPKYEDVTTLPAPPSYDDVLAGNYRPSPSPSSYNPLSGTYNFETNPRPPPSYQYYDSVA